MRAGADLDALFELRCLLGRRADDIDDLALTVARRIDQFRDLSSEYVPPLPPHHARGRALADRLDGHGRAVATTHEALVVADRWVGTTAALWLRDRLDEHAKVEVTRHAGAELWTRWRRSVRTGQDVPLLTHPHFLDADAASHFAGAAWRRQVSDSAADVGHLIGRGATPYQPTTGATGRVVRAVERFRATRAGSAVRLGGRALGVAGIALSGVDVVQGVRTGDEERVATGALGAAAGVAMLSGFPPAQLAGAVVAGGLLLYEYRQEIGAGVRSAGRAVGNAARAAADFVTGLF